MARKKKSTPNAVNQTEVFIKSAVSGNTMTPITQTEKFVADVINKEEVTPKTHDEKFIKWAIENSSGETPVLIEKTITENGVYNASSDNANGYSSVTANVPNTYAAADEGKVVSNGELVSQSSATYTENDTYDTTLINSVTVNVSGGGNPPEAGTITIINNVGYTLTQVRSVGGKVENNKIVEDLVLTPSSTFTIGCPLYFYGSSSPTGYRLFGAIQFYSQSGMQGKKFAFSSNDITITEMSNVPGGIQNKGRTAWIRCYTPANATTGTITLTIVDE